MNTINVTSNRVINPSFVYVHEIIYPIQGQRSFSNHLQYVFMLTSINDLSIVTRAKNTMHQWRTYIHEWAMKVELKLFLSYVKARVCCIYELLQIIYTKFLKRNFGYYYNDTSFMMLVFYMGSHANSGWHSAWLHGCD